MTNPNLSPNELIRLQSASAVLRLYNLTHEILSRSLIPAGFTPSRAFAIRQSLDQLGIEIRQQLEHVHSQLNYEPDALIPEPEAK